MVVGVRGGANVDMKGPRLWAVIGMQLNKLGFYMVSIQLSSSNIHLFGICAWDDDVHSCR